MHAVPFRAEQVGSLLRPPELVAVRVARAAGRVDLAELRAAEDDAIGQALRRQRDLGLDILTDGELRRGSWLAELGDAVEGFTDGHVLLDWKGPGAAVEPTRARVVGGPLRQRRHLAAWELPFLQQAAPGPFKVTLPAPSNFMFASYQPGVTDKVYATRAALLDAVARILHDELAWLADEGVAYVQLDAPYYSHYLDARQRGLMKDSGVDPDEALETAIAGDNAALAGAGGDMFTALHICRGNNRSRWYTEGAYDAIAERLFATLDVNAFLLEFDDERSGGFEPLRLLPEDKHAVLGLVTTKKPAIESPDEVRRRIDEASRFAPLERLALSTQCGFASTEAGNLLSEDDQWRKLAVVAEVARKVWNND